MELSSEQIYLFKALFGLCLTGILFLLAFFIIKKFVDYVYDKFPESLLDEDEELSKL